MTAARSYESWLRRVRRLVPRQRSQAVRAAANASDTFWRDCWHAGMTPRAAMARLRELWS